MSSAVLGQEGAQAHAGPLEQPGKESCMGKIWKGATLENISTAGKVAVQTLSSSKCSNGAFIRGVLPDNLVKTAKDFSWNDRSRFGKAVIVIGGATAITSLVAAGYFLPIAQTASSFAPECIGFFSEDQIILANEDEQYEIPEATFKAGIGKVQEGVSRARTFFEEREVVQLEEIELVAMGPEGQVLENENPEVPAEEDDFVVIDKEDAEPLVEIKSSLGLAYRTARVGLYVICPCTSAAGNAVGTLAANADIEKQVNKISKTSQYAAIAGTTALVAAGVFMSSNPIGAMLGITAFAFSAKSAYSASVKKDAAPVAESV